MDDGQLTIGANLEKFMTYKFEKLEVWQMAMDNVDPIYSLAEELPHNEDYNLKSQMTRAATSIALNIAEGSTGQSDAEQTRFLGMAIRSLKETVACQHLIRRRKFFNDETKIEIAYLKSQTLARKLQSFRKALIGDSKQISEEPPSYLFEVEI